MNRSTSGARPALAVGVVFATVVFWHSVASAAPTTAWDQARVTEIAEQLAAAADKLYEHTAILAHHVREPPDVSQSDRHTGGRQGGAPRGAES